jgi:ATP-dependent Lon protease
MTGEITLSGNVLPVGGIKEKFLAARRAGVQTIILPAENRQDVEEDLTPELTAGVDVHYASRIEDVLAVALPTLKASQSKAGHESKPGAVEIPVSAAA